MLFFIKILDVKWFNLLLTRNQGFACVIPKCAGDGESGSSEEAWPGVQQKAILPLSPPHLAQWKSSTSEPGMFLLCQYLCVCTLRPQRNSKPKSLTSVIFQEGSRAKMRKICCFSSLFAVVWGVFFGCWFVFFFSS